MSLYLDTSVVIAALVVEPKSRDVQDWLAATANRQRAISDWVVTEAASALSLKIRTRQIDVAVSNGATILFADMRRSFLTTHAVLREDFAAGGGYASRHDLGLRSGDALHAAIAARLGLELCTLDQRLAAAGLELGVRTRLL